MGIWIKSHSALYRKVHSVPKEKQHPGSLRDATAEELNEARSITKSIISSDLQFIDQSSV